MKLTIPRDTLAAAVDRVARLASKRSPLPILKCVLLQAEDGCLRLSATDLQLSVSIQTEANVEIGGEGSVAVPGALLGDLVKRLPDGQVSIETTNGDTRIQFRSGRSKLHLNSLPGEEFPSLPVPEGAGSVEIPQPEFCALVRRVSRVAAKQDEARPALTGILVQGHPDQIFACATDGRRLSWTSTPLPEQDGRQIEAVVPAVALGEIIHLLGGEGPVLARMDKDSTRITFEAENILASSQLLAGAFPDFNRVIPKTFSAACTCSRNDLRQALQRMLLVANEKDSPSLVVLDFQPDSIRFSANTPDLGGGEDSISATLAGDPLRCAFNGAYLLDALAAIETPEVEWRLQDPTKSSVLRPPSDDRSAHVIMPVRLREDIRHEN